MSPARPSPPKFPVLKEAEKLKPDTWAPGLLGHWLGLEKQDKNDVAHARGWLGEWNVEHSRLQKGLSSWNWDWMLGSAALFDPDRRDREKVAEWWIALLEMQLRKAPGDGFLDRFEGSEPLSSTYTAWRVGSALAVLRWCLAGDVPAGFAQRAEVLAGLVRRWLEVWAGLQALGMAPWPDRKGHRAGNGQMWWDGGTPSPVGERSTHSYDPDIPAVWSLLTDRRFQKDQRTTWPTLVFRKSELGRVLDEETARTFRTYVESGEGLDRVLAKLDGIALFGVFHWFRLPDGLLVYREERLNNNSPTHLYSWAPNDAQTLDLGFPMPKNGRWRGRNAPRGGTGRMTVDRARAVVEAEIAEEQRKVEIGDWRPLSHVVGDENGVRPVAG